MPLSSRIIKSMQANTSETSDWIIDTVYDYIEEEAENHLQENGEARDALEQAKEKSTQLIEKALSEKEQLLMEAEQEISKLKEEAYKEAFEEGKRAGLESGFAEGKAAGYQAGKQESEGLVNQARQSVLEAQQDIEQYIEEKKESLLSLSVHMAEKIVHNQLDLSPDGILELVHPILHQLDRKEDYVSLTVHSSKRQLLREKMTSLEKNYPDVRFVVFQDDNIEANGCVVESTHKVVDLQVRKQLEAMIEDMKEREREM